MKFFSSFLFFNLLFLLFTACPTSSYDPQIRPLSTRVYRDLRPRPLGQRVVGSPGFLLSHLQYKDERPDYTVYHPREEELRLLEITLSYLPDSLREGMDSKLMAFHFVSGLEDHGRLLFALNDQDELSYLMLLNPELFQLQLSQWQQFKEQKLFNLESGEISVRLEGEENSALLGEILLQGAWLLNYEKGFTPFISQEFQTLERPIGEDFPFIQNIWSTMNQVHPRWETGSFFHNDSQVVLESLRLWRRGPFVSIRASRAMEEDWVQWYTLGWLTQGLGYFYEMAYWVDGEVLWFHRPREKFFIRPLDWIEPRP